MWTWAGTQDNGAQLPEQLLYQVAVDLLRDLLLDPVVHVRGVAGVELVHHDAFRQLETEGKRGHFTTLKPGLRSSKVVIKGPLMTCPFVEKS